MGDSRRGDNLRFKKTTGEKEADRPVPITC